MTKPSLALPVLIAAALAVGGGSALAQGTPEQREACAPDAVRICPDTIPDVERTKACMQAHVSELTPRCRAVFDAATAPPVEPRDEGQPYAKRHVPRSTTPTARLHEPRDDAYGERRAARQAPEERGGPEEGGEAPDGRSYRYLGPRGEITESPDGGPYPPMSQAPLEDEDGPGPDAGRGWNGEDQDRARAEIGRLCDEGEMDPRTCDTTQRALGGAR